METCFEANQYDRWVEQFTISFRTIDSTFMPSDEIIALLFKELILKIIHARFNTFIKEYKDLNFSRFYSAKNSTHSSIREILKQTKAIDKRSPFEKKRKK